MTVDRVAARVLVVDRAGAVLLLRGGDPRRPEAGTWWFTPGGGLDDGEAPHDGARRELAEETGLAVAQLGPVVHERDAAFEFEGEHYRQREYFFAVVVDRFEPITDGWSEIERRSVHELRWWTRGEIVASRETFYPEDLVELLTRLVDG